MTYKIESGVPLPASIGRRKYPFDGMGIGDSFAFDADVCAKVRAAADAYGRKYGMKFTVAKAALRCWRVS